MHPRVERVEHVGPVQRDRHHAAFTGDLDLRHASSLRDCPGHSPRRLVTGPAPPATVSEMAELVFADALFGRARDGGADSDRSDDDEALDAYSRTVSAVARRLAPSV